MHPLAVQGSRSENRWSQTRHEIFSPLPCKMICVAPSGGGKSSVMLTFANAVFENMDTWAIFSRSHMLDPALLDLKKHIRERYKERGVDEDVHPFLFKSGFAHAGPRRAEAARARVEGRRPARDAPPDAVRTH